jgi:hypothetical protein
MNFDALKQMLMQKWQQLQQARSNQGQAVQQWQQNTGAVAPILQSMQQNNPQPQTGGLPSLSGALPSVVQAGRSALQSIPSAGQMDANAQAMKQKLMQSQMMQHLMSLFGGQ